MRRTTGTAGFLRLRFEVPRVFQAFPRDEKVWRLWVLDWCSSWKWLSEHVQLSLLMNRWRRFSQPKSQINKPDSNNSRNLITAAFHFEAAVVEQKYKNIFLLVWRKSLNELLQTQPSMNPFAPWTKNQINNSLWKNSLCVLFLIMRLNVH